MDHVYPFPKTGNPLLFSRLQQERDSAEKESREKETKILSLNRELDEIRDRLEQVERQKAAQQRELEDLVSSKDDVGKNVSHFIENLHLKKKEFEGI